MDLIILTGMPATGKSTIAANLSKAFRYPILEKDNIKEGLFDILGLENYAQKRKLDHASNEVLLRILESMMKAGSSLIVDNNFDTVSTEKLYALIEAYQPNCVTIFLHGDSQTLYERYVQRDSLRKRHLGHILQDHYPPHEGDDLNYSMTRDEFDEKFFKRGMDQFKCPGERLEVDVTDFAKVDNAALVCEVQNLLGRYFTRESEEHRTGNEA